MCIWWKPYTKLPYRGLVIFSFQNCNNRSVASSVVQESLALAGYVTICVQPRLLPGCCVWDISGCHQSPVTSHRSHETGHQSPGSSFKVNNRNFGWFKITFHNRTFGWFKITADNCNFWQPNWRLVQIYRYMSSIWGIQNKQKKIKILCKKLRSTTVILYGPK